MARQRQSAATPGKARRTPRVVVVGAGVGGLACAAELAARGLEVVVLERAATPGGKLREVLIDGRPLDAGPTVFTMRWVFDELFAAAGASFDAALTLRPLATLARHAWSESARLDLHADSARTVDAISAFAGPAEGRRYQAFCARAAEIYRTLEAPFLRASRPTPASLVARAGWRGLPALLRISPFATMHGELAKQFGDPRLVQLFARYATYCGSSPYLAPATLMLVAHVEQEGVWTVEGGMKRLAEALAGLLARGGGVLRCDTEVARIVVEAGRARGAVVVTASGGEERIDADAVVFNGDVAALGAGLLGAPAARAAAGVPLAKRSLSALTWNAVGTASGFPLHRHNVFFGNDYAAEFDAVFSRGLLPADPTTYVCALDRHDGGLAPMLPVVDTGETSRVSAPAQGDERFLCLINAPARGDARPLDAATLADAHASMDRVLRRCGLTIAHADANEQRTGPTDFARLFPGSGGALYGQASHGWAASFSRPGARSRMAGLYLAGGTVHPGPGVPMAALSGRQAAASVLADLARR